MKLTIDPDFQSLIPPLSEEELAGLTRNVQTNGCQDSIKIWNGTIVDGHNRYAICSEHGIEFETTDMDFENKDDAKIWIIERQFDRRNLNPYQRGRLALIIKPLIAKKANEQQGARTDLSPTLAKSSSPIDTREEVAKAAQVSHGTLSKIEKIEEKATPEQKEQLDAGEVSVNHIHKQIKTQERREEKTQEILELSQKPTNALDDLGVFPVIYADPPWRYEHSKSDSRKIENQYPTMTLDDIKGLSVPATPDAILFLWGTSPKLAEAMEVINAWGFNYRTCMVWVKDKIGMGYYARQRHELLLIATKGNMLTPEPANRPDSVIEAPRTEHSQKPRIVYELIEKMYPELPKLEMFARTKKEGWSVWGNQSP